MTGIKLFASHVALISFVTGMVGTYLAYQTGPLEVGLNLMFGGLLGMFLGTVILVPSGRRRP